VTRDFQDDLANLVGRKISAKELRNYGAVKQQYDELKTLGSPKDNWALMRSGRTGLMR
jgi:hypothetical protein